DVRRVQPGQRVRVESAALPRPLEGEVLYATAQADVQKNTLAVKVSISDPPTTLKPEMLVQVTFLAPPRLPSQAPGPRPLRLLVSRRLVESTPSGPRVWVADQAAGVARHRPVELGPTEGELVEVLSGLNAADKLIAGGREGLVDGQRISVTAEAGEF